MPIPSCHSSGNHREHFLMVYNVPGPELQVLWIYEADLVLLISLMRKLRHWKVEYPMASKSTESGFTNWVQVVLKVVRLTSGSPSPSCQLVGDASTDNRNCSIIIKYVTFHHPHFNTPYARDSVWILIESCIHRSAKQSVTAEVPVSDHVSYALEVYSTFSSEDMWQLLQKCCVALLHLLLEKPAVLFCLNLTGNSGLIRSVCFRDRSFSKSNRWIFICNSTASFFCY